ncbi:MAG TPA: PrpF domain-containing protein [Pseudonocardiaceae bacterium]|nr:PrpF domain-containing protein [Pseudonocardiaceae bacterium]
MTGVRCLLMRGGTSKGAYFLAGDLPADPAERDDLLLRDAAWSPPMPGEPRCGSGWSTPAVPLSPAIDRSAGHTRPRGFGRLR